MKQRLHMKKRCPETGKRRYRESLDVLIDNQHNPRTIRAYECPHCNDWHATSKPERKPRPEPPREVRLATAVAVQGPYARCDAARRRRRPHGRPRGRGRKP